MKLTALLTLVLVLVAAGCGGGGGTSAEEEAWADEVCASIASWRTEVETIATDAAEAITEPGATRETVESAIERRPGGDEDAPRRSARRSTAGHARRRRGASGGRRVPRQRAHRRTTRSSPLSRIPEDAGLAAVIAELSGLAANLQATVTSGQTLVTEITELGGSLKDAFENADSCQELREPE